jgi:hypothetical protein
MWYLSMHIGWFGGGGRRLVFHVLDMIGVGFVAVMELAMADGVLTSCQRAVDIYGFLDGMEGSFSAANPAANYRSPMR